MPRVSGPDYRKVLDVLFEAADADGLNPFPDAVLGALRRLVPCDVVAYHDRLGAQSAVAWVGEPRGPLTPEVREASGRHWHTCPLTPAVGARKYSDVLSARAFRRPGRTTLHRRRQSLALRRGSGLALPRNGP